MELKDTKQVEEEVLSNIEFAAMICSSGYETRSIFIPNSFTINVKKKYSLSFDNFVDILNRPYNDLFFSKNKYSSYKICGDDYSVLKEIIIEIIAENSANDELNILIDYTCMTRVWYGYILEYFNQIRLNKNVHLYFAYAKSEYTEPPNHPVYNRKVNPVTGYYSLSTPHKPTALIIGLGYIEKQAYALSEFFDAECFLFIGKTSNDDLFYDKVVENNIDLIKNTIPENVFIYDMFNLLYSETMLNRLCKDLISDHKIILAPCGPKPFTLLSFITSIKLEEVDVWRISIGDSESTIDYKPTGEVIILQVTFED